jgi:transposase
MAKYKRSDAAAGQGMFLSVNLTEQLLPGTFEHTLNEPVDNELVITGVDHAYQTGRPGTDPRILLKLVLYGYSRGKNSSRKIEELSKYTIRAKAVSPDMAADHAARAAFVSGNSEKLKRIFTEVLMMRGELKLIGGEQFAIDGRRLPSNAASETKFPWSGAGPMRN